MKRLISNPKGMIVTMYDFNIDCQGKNDILFYYPVLDELISDKGVKCVSFRFNAWIAFVDWSTCNVPRCSVRHDYNTY